MISAVRPDKIATIPTSMFTTSATIGVWLRGWMRPSSRGA